MALLLGSVLVFGGCSGHGKGDDAGKGKGQREAGELSGEGPSAPAANDRIAPPKGEAIGSQPGYVDGAIVHASVELGALHGLLRTLPFGAGARRDLDELATLVPDPLGEDLLARLGLAADARLSLSLRPITTWEDELAPLVHAPSPELDALRAWRSAPMLDVDGEPLKIEPPSPAVTVLDRKIKSLGFHLRVDLPVASPAKLRPLLARVGAGLSDDGRWRETCEALGPVLACGGPSDGVVVIREREDGVIFDLCLNFVGDRDKPDGRLRRLEIEQALALGPGPAPADVAALRGDLGIAIDGPGISALVRIFDLAKVLGYDHGDPVDAVAHYDRRMSALAELRADSSARLFAGLTLAATLGPDAFDAELRWRVREGASSQLASVFALSEIDADVPSVAALCEGALICARSRGLPAFDRFAGLATGLFADPDRLTAQIDRHEELARAVLLLETWPNAIASLGRLPKTLSAGPEAYMAQSALDLATRVLGFGVSVRAIDRLDGGLRGDWLAYARASGGDLATLTSYLQLAELRLAPTSIAEVDATVGVAPIPDPALGGNLYSLIEPGGAWGWVVLADADPRVRWFAGLAHDDGAAPLAYVEVSDLWRVVSSSPDLTRELGHARAWLARRWVRAQVEHGGGGSPVFRLAMGQRG